MNQDKKLAVVDNMKKYGGSFVQALAECILRADPKNLRRLEDTFQEYFYQYSPKKWEHRA